MVPNLFKNQAHFVKNAQLGSVVFSQRLISIPLITLSLLLPISLPIGTQARPLKVGVHGTEPFLKKTGGIYEGISVDIWQSVAEANGLSYKFYPQPDIETSVNAVADGSLDAAIGAITITPQRISNESIKFTQPYFFADHTILVHSQPPNLISRLKPFFAWAVFSSIAVLLGILFVVGNLVWLAERRRNFKQFPRNYFSGVGNGIWLAVVTLTTVGFGDITPTSRTGRGITGLWMIFSMVAVSSITAALASAFTISLTEDRASIVSPGQIHNKRIGVVRGSSSVTTAKAYGGKPKIVGSLNQAVELLLDNKVEGVIFDRPTLRYYIKEHPSEPIELVNFNLSKETFGFVLQADSLLQRPIDVQLLRLFSSGEIDQIANRVLD